MQKVNKNSAIASSAYLLFGMLCIAAGNGLTIAANVGSAFWTAASVNISSYFPISVGMTTALLGMIALLLNVLIKRTFDWRQSTASIVYMLFFGQFINFFTDLFLSWGMETSPFFIRIIAALLGIFVLACGVSVYQRVHIVVHPIDELMHTLRFVFFKGDAIKGQLASFVPPIMICLVMWGITGSLYAIHIGTLIAFLCQGPFVAWADRHIFLKLKHRYVPYTKQ